MRHQDLLTGYHLLADVLSDESRIRYLVVLKKVTLRGEGSAQREAG